MDMKLILQYVITTAIFTCLAASEYYAPMYGKPDVGECENLNVLVREEDDAEKLAGNWFIYQATKNVFQIKTGRSGITCTYRVVNSDKCRAIKWSINFVLNARCNILVRDEPEIFITETHFRSVVTSEDSENNITFQQEEIMWDSNYYNVFKSVQTKVLQGKKSETIQMKPIPDIEPLLTVYQGYKFAVVAVHWGQYVIFQYCNVTSKTPVIFVALHPTIYQMSEIERRSIIAEIEYFYEINNIPRESLTTIKGGLDDNLGVFQGVEPMQICACRVGEQ